MKFGPRRGHFLYIFDNFFANFGLLIIAIAAGILSGDVLNAIEQNAGVVAVVLIAPIGRLLKFLFTKFEVDDEKLVVKSGLFNKKEVETPLATITTIDVSQNIICRLFHAYKLKVNNTSNIAIENNDSKINMIFGERDAVALKTLLESKKKGLDGINLVENGDALENKEIIQDSIKVDCSKILLMGLLESKRVLILEGIGVFCALVGYLSSAVLDEAVDSILSLSAIIVAVIIGGFLVVMMVIGAMLSMIRYAGFSVSNRKDSIGLSYGLLTKKSYTLNKDRISGFSYSQSWLMRKFHVGTLQVFAVGFGADSEDSHEEAILHPLLEESKVQDFMKHFLDEFETGCDTEAVPKEALRYFFFRPSIVFSIILLMATVAISLPWVPWAYVLGVVILAVSIVGKIMEYKNTRVGGNEKNIEIGAGGWNYTRTFIKTSNVESVTDTASRFKRRKGIVSIGIDFLGPLATTTVNAYNVREAAFSKIKDLMVY